MQSEAVLAGLLLSGKYSALALVAVAGVGNVLGSWINWWLGRYIERWKDRRWFPVTPEALGRAEGWYRRYGRWSLLLSWAPVIGDPLTVLAGVLREPWQSFLPLVAAAKIGRYCVLAAIVQGWFGQ
ncbi:MAG: DedA family protein [Candidatus Adiutrix sp.]|jgi:membrane protein YqaA with SNARE-associated domain|nr:DedA family protein [Candidatus Adiutrix sp.]